MLDLDKHLDIKKLNFLPAGPYGILTASLIVGLLALGLFGSLMWPASGGPSRVSGSASVANALELDVMNIDPVIAKHFRLSEVSGVLINDIPRGTARRLIGLKRGDVILKFNDVSVQSTEHLGHLMSHTNVGESIRFLVSRNGEHIGVSTKIPKPAGIGDFFRPTVINTAVVLLIFAVTFTSLFFNLLDRTVCLMLGAVLMLVAGSLLGFYDQGQAYRSIHMSPILILVGMSIFSISLERLKFFDYAAKRIVLLMEGNGTRVAVALCVMTYALSLLINNLTTILVTVPITLYTYRNLKMSPIPVVIGEIIASNIGGASTMIGDFPNILISSNTGLPFVDFLVYMTPICFVLLVAVISYLKYAEFSKMKNVAAPTIKQAFLKKLEVDLATMSIDWDTIKRVLGTLALVVIGLIILPAYGLKAATITLGGGFILLAMDRHHARDTIKKISFTDILFFIALFILVGGALHSGLLEGMAGLLDQVSMHNRYAYCLILMWGVAFITAFLNAGPAAAFFLPVVLTSPFAASSDIVWWTLSLGILAGSSATLTGATAGIVTQTILDNDREEQGTAADLPLLTFGAYSKCGVPIALIMLILSSVYIAFLESLPGIP